MAKTKEKKTDSKKKQLDNLKPFVKGESGNPKGRPPGTENSTTRLKRLLSLVQSKKNPVSGKDENFTMLEQMDMAMILKALKGDVNAYREILDRWEGKATQTNINVNKVGVEAEKEEYV